MNAKLHEDVPITMRKGELLVIFEFLARSYECWRQAPGSEDDASFVLQTPDAGERTALWHLEGAIERTLPEIFSSEYKQLSASWKQHLISS